MKLRAMLRMKLRTVNLTIAFILFLFLFGCNSTGNVVSDNAKNSASVDDYIRIPLSDITHEAKFYTFNDDGVEIRYLAVMASDGNPRVAFDACDVCGGYKGYRQQGNDMVCNNCGRHFNIDDLGSKNIGGGCWPGYLPHAIKDDNIFIKIQDVKLRRGSFA